MENLQGSLHYIIHFVAPKCHHHHHVFSHMFFYQHTAAGWICTLNSKCVQPEHKGNPYPKSTMLPFAFVTVDFLRIVRYIAGLSKKNVYSQYNLQDLYWTLVLHFSMKCFFFTIFHCPVELAPNFKEKFKRQLQYMQYLLCDFDFFFSIFKHYSFTYYTKNASYVTYNL